MAQVEQNLRRAAELISQANAILVTSGAGMGVPSGIGTFRGNTAGVWEGYSVQPNLDYTHLTNPVRFVEDPNFAWSFWQWKYNSFCLNQPHEGYHMVHRWCEGKEFGAFSFTSNIDGHWLAAGFNNVVECHGTVRHLQCLRLDPTCAYYNRTWPSPHEMISTMPVATDGTFKIQGEIPRCPGCQGCARPSVFMFGDSTWLSTITQEQEAAFNAWIKMLKQNQARLVVLEIGAGITVPTIRWQSEQIAQEFRCPLIRINPVHASNRSGMGNRVFNFEFLSIPLGCTEALAQIDALRNQ